MNLNIIIVKEEEKKSLKIFCSLFLLIQTALTHISEEKKKCQELVQCYSWVVCNSVQVGYLGLTLINLLTTVEGGTRVTDEKIQGAIIEPSLDV